MPLHETYVRHVCAPGFAFDAAHLGEHFLDAMIAHVLAVRRLSLTQTVEAQQVIARLLRALNSLRSSSLVSTPTTPDLYTAYLEALERTVGPHAVGYLRLGLSRNDLDMTAYRMHARRLVLGLAQGLRRLRAALLVQAAAHLHTVFIAQTHHRPAQPTTLAHYLAAVDSMVERDLGRLLQAFRRVNQCPLGAAALGGTSYGLDRAYVARLLGFARPVVNTLDAVAAADWEVELCGVLATSAVGLSRLVADLIAWAQPGVFTLPPTLCEGSSIMPQKRNPVALEHVRASLSRVVALAQAPLVSSHNIPFSDHNDCGPDIQGALAQGFAEMGQAVELLSVCLEEGAFDPQRLTADALASDATATELADHLTRAHGLPFGEAHRVVAALVDRMLGDRRRLADARPEDLVAVGGPSLGEEEMRAALDVEEFVRRRCELGGPEQGVMEEHIRNANRRLDAWQRRLSLIEETLRRCRRSLVSEREVP